jgi:uracil phosphoribosyltransferase
MDENVTPSSENSPAPPPPPLRQAPPPLVQPQYLVQRKPRSSTGWKVFGLISFVLLVMSLFLNPLGMLLGMFKGQAPLQTHRHTVGPKLQEALVEDNNSRNKVAVIPIEGIIVGQSFGRNGYNMVDLIEEQFRRASEDRNVKAVILKVNSPGGEVLASDDISKLIEKFQNNSRKPVVAAMGSLAASGGYYVSAPCRWIVANEMTITGSIGVIMHGYNYRGLMDKVGLRPEVFKSGKFKDMLSGDKRPEDITDEEREMVQSLVNETFDKFKSVVSKGRRAANNENQKLSEKGVALDDDWGRLADGRILSGKEAFKYGFVDELGNFDVAVEARKKTRQYFRREPDSIRATVRLHRFPRHVRPDGIAHIESGFRSRHAEASNGRPLFPVSAHAAPVNSVTLIEHPLVQHNLTRLRDQNTRPEEFRRCLAEVATLMVYEATRSFPTDRVRVTTPLAETDGFRLQREVILVPVLRAGLGMLPSILQLIPHASVGFIGLKRHEETLHANAYHKSLPENLSGFEIILIDPMLATGGSALAALDLLFERRAEHVRLVNLVAAPEEFAPCALAMRHCRSLRRPSIRS